METLGILSVAPRECLGVFRGGSNFEGQFTPPEFKRGKEKGENEKKKKEKRSEISAYFSCHVVKINLLQYLRGTKSSSRTKKSALFDCDKV